MLQAKSNNWTLPDGTSTHDADVYGNAWMSLSQRICDTLKRSFDVDMEVYGHDSNIIYLKCKGTLLRWSIPTDVALKIADSR